MITYYTRSEVSVVIGLFRKGTYSFLTRLFKVLKPSLSLIGRLHRGLFMESLTTEINLVFGLTLSQTHLVIPSKVHKSLSSANTTTWSHLIPLHWSICVVESFLRNKQYWTIYSSRTSWLQTEHAYTYDINYSNREDDDGTTVACRRAYVLVYNAWVKHNAVGN